MDKEDRKEKQVGGHHEVEHRARLDDNMEHEGHRTHDRHKDHGDHVDHTGHEGMFRRKFWVTLVLSIPVLVYSPTIQEWLNYTAPTFPGSQWITNVGNLRRGGRYQGSDRRLPGAE